MPTIHVIGAGLAGLACALDLLGSGGRRVIVHEASGHAGGRCRSFHDSQLDRLVDNGSHLLLWANEAVRRYVDRIGGPGLEVLPAAFPFLDLKSGRTWCLRPNRGRLGWWLLSAGRRVPDTAAIDYLAAIRLARAPADATVAQVLNRASPLFESLWRPLTEAILNTAPEEAQARLLWTVLAETLLRGGDACRPLLAPAGLGPTLVEPAVDTILRAGGEIAFNHALAGIDRDGQRVAGLRFRDDAVALGPDDHAVLAVPPWVARALLPDLVPDLESRPIVNAHFRLAAPPDRSLPSVLGLVGGVAQWLFHRGDVISVTVSAATALADEPADSIAGLLWRDLAAALGRPGVVLADGAVAWRVVKERRATIAHTPDQARRRPQARTALANLTLAGDWTATGIPCTLEGAVRSGVAAAKAASYVLCAA